MKIAIIDCGTNTFHLLIVEIAATGKYTQLYKTKTVVKLGEDGITKNYISEIPFDRGIHALKSFANKIAEYNADNVYAFATAALRRAKNGHDFIAEAKKQSGIKIQLITGYREAELIYYGVREAIEMGDEKSLIIDIGGGSTEFIICNQKNIFWKHSFELGAAMLLEKLNPSDPITKEEIHKLNTFLEKELDLLLEACNKFKPEKIIGSSGSFDSFAEMILALNNKSPLGKRISYEFKMEDYFSIHQQLIHSTTQQRTQMKGLIKMRVDMIVLASGLLTFVLEKTGIRRMTLSAYALKEGMLFEIMNNE